MTAQIVIFNLDKDEFAIEISSIESIIKLQAITKLPHAPNFVEGVTNLRGNIVPVIDLKKRLSLSQSEPTIHTRIIVTTFQDSKIGMIVDGVEQVIEVEDELIENNQSMKSSIVSAFIKGVVKIDKRLVMLLDIDLVLSTNRNNKN